MKRLLVVIALLAIGCASTQARLHPNLSPVGTVVANVNTLDDAVLAIQTKVETFVDAYCGANRSPSCQAAQLAEPVMRTAKLIGQGSIAVGDAFKAYLIAQGAIAQAAAEQYLLQKITDLETAGTALATQSFTVIAADVKTVRDDLAALTASAKKGL